MLKRLVHTRPAAIMTSLHPLLLLDLNLLHTSSGSHLLLDLDLLVFIKSDLLRRHKAPTSQGSIPTTVRLLAIAHDSYVKVVTRLASTYATLYQLIKLIIDNASHSLREGHTLPIEGSNATHRGAMIHQEYKGRGVLTCDASCVGILALKLCRL